MDKSLAHALGMEDLRGAQVDADAWSDEISKMLDNIQPLLDRLYGKRLRPDDVSRISKYWEKTVGRGDLTMYNISKKIGNRAIHRCLYFGPNYKNASPFSRTYSGIGSNSMSVKGMGIKLDTRRLEIVDSNPRIHINQHFLHRWIERGNPGAIERGEAGLRLKELRSSLAESLPMLTFWMAGAWARGQLREGESGRGEVATPLFLPVGDGLAFGSVTASEHLAGFDNLGVRIDKSSPLMKMNYDKNGHSVLRGAPHYELGGPLEFRFATWVSRQRIRGAGEDLLDSMQGLMEDLDREQLSDIMSRVLVPFQNDGSSSEFDKPLNELPLSMMSKFTDLVNDAPWEIMERIWRGRTYSSLRRGGMLSSWETPKEFADVGRWPLTMSAFLRPLNGRECLTEKYDPEAIENMDFFLEREAGAASLKVDLLSQVESPVGDKLPAGTIEGLASGVETGSDLSIKDDTSDQSPSPSGP
jgi:hypothetical protein